MKNVVKIKPGDIVLLKNYNIFKRIWYKLRNKELPYNDAYIVIWTNDVEILKHKQVKVLTLKKAYNLKERSKLLEKVELLRQTCSVFPFLYLEPAELKFLVNSIRPNTFKTGDIDEVLNSEYYKHLSYGTIEI